MRMPRFADNTGVMPARRENESDFVRAQQVQFVNGMPGGDVIRFRADEKAGQMNIAERNAPAACDELSFGEQKSLIQQVVRWISPKRAAESPILWREIDGMRTCRGLHEFAPVRHGVDAQGSTTSRRIGKMERPIGTGQPER